VLYKTYFIVLYFIYKGGNRQPLPQGGRWLVSVWCFNYPKRVRL